jgi:hypothetical protein
MHAYFKEHVLKMYPIAIFHQDARATETQAWLILGKERGMAWQMSFAGGS